MPVNIKSYKPDTQKVKPIARPKRTFSFRSEIKLHKFGNKKKLQFFADLSVLLSSGVDIVSSLNLVEDNFTNENDQKVIQQIRSELSNGESLSFAMNKTNKFSPYEYHSIEIGEETGTLNTVVENLVNYYKRVIEQKKKIISAFSYPVLVLLTAFGALSFMLGFVVPMFEEIFSRYGHDLPWITKSVIKISETFSENGLIILVVVIILSFVVFYLTKQPLIKKVLSQFVLRVPYFGDLIKKIILLRFCTAFELLLKAHTPLSQSLDLLKKMITFYPIAMSFDKIQTDISAGKSLHESLSSHSFYDKRMLSLIGVAEQVNQLDRTFENLKEQYTEEINYKTTMMGNVLEPVLIILVGAIVGVILISMYLPIFEFSSSVSN